MNLREKAVNGVVWSVIQKWGMEAISFVVFIVLSRLLTPEAFGLVTMALVFTYFIQIFLDHGFGAAIVQREDLEPAHLDTAFWTSVITGTLLTIGGIAASDLVAGLFKEPQLDPIVKWLSVSFILGALSSTQMAILQRRFAFKSLAARTLVATLAGGVVGVGMAIAGFGVWSLVAQNLVKTLAAALVLWWASDWRPGFDTSWRHFKDLFSFGVSVTGTKLLEFFNRRSDDFLIGFFLGPTLLGYYAIGYRLLLVMIRLLTGIINFVAAPTFSRLQSKPERMRRAFYKVTQYTSLMALPTFLGLAVLAPDLVPALFGDQWTPSIPVMQILALFGILQSMLVFNGSVIKASGKPSWQFSIMMILSVCSMVGFVLAVQWGIVAVAASLVVVGYSLAPISYLALHRLIHIDVKIYLGQFAAPLFASLMMAVVVLALRILFEQQGLNVYLRLTMCVVAGALTYLLVILLTARPLALQVLELVGLAIPDSRLRKTYNAILSNDTRFGN